MILYSHIVFPTFNIKKTSDFYTNFLGFKSVEYLNASEPHICLYKDNIEIILTKSNKEIIPNRIMYGYGYDAYLISDNLIDLEKELKEKGVKIVRPLNLTDYNNNEFVIEDIDGRWLGIGLKQK